MLLQWVYLYVEGRGFHVEGRGYHVEGNNFFKFFFFFEKWKTNKAIPMKCFVSHGPPYREGGSVGRAKKKKKKDWTHDCILNLTFSLQDIIRW